MGPAVVRVLPFGDHASPCTRPVDAVAFDPDGTTMATGADDGTARLWTVATGTARRTFQGDGTAVTDLAFGPGGDGLIALTAEAPR